ncbi:LysR substrate-binding domain-containing protein [Corynebacterium hansenii]|uniref:LysR substrate-binding domain-containing protein n=1 Tax=Corynebacterium hansenii TaxID=394964 RepID=A0ABV7ZPE3_9CORY|nr:LysR substrate-binding domain-containing protein [Corynebacterium hansenii]
MSTDPSDHAGAAGNAAANPGAGAESGPVAGADSDPGAGADSGPGASDESGPVAESPDRARGRVLRVAFVPGAMPEKWFRRYRERTGLALTAFSADDPVLEVHAGRADMALARDPREDDSLHRIRLYDEAPGIAVEREHVLSLVGDGDVVDRGDLEGETVLLDASVGAEPGAVRDMLQVVATGAGVLLAPRPLLRALNARGTTHREIAPAPGAEPTTLWLTWPKAADDELTQELAGIVRGRREGSRRSALADDAAPKKKLTAREKTLAKQARRQAEAGGANRTGKSGGKRGGKPGAPGGRGKGVPRKPRRRR